MITYVTPRPPPVSQVSVQLLLDNLGVARVAVPGVVTIEGNNVKMLTGMVLQTKNSIYE